MTPLAPVRRFVPSCSLGAAAALLAALPALAQPAPRGPEVAVDTVDGYYFSAPILAGRRDGTCGVAWSRWYERGEDIQKFVVATADANGGISEPSELGSADFRMSFIDFVTVPGGYRALWQRAAGAGGELVATDVGLDGTPRGVARRLARVGAGDWSPRPRGGYVVWWGGFQTLAVQLVAEDGTAGEIARLPVPDFSYATVLHQSDASFLLIYERYGGSGVAYPGPRVQRFDADGHPVGKSFRVLPTPGPTGLAYYKAALGADGTLALASSTADDGAAPAHAVTLRTFTASGVPLGRPFALTTAEEDASEESFALAVAVDPNGRVLVVWEKGASPYAATARARLFDRHGRPLGPAFDPRTSASDPYTAIPSASVDWAGDDWVISWVGSTDASDGSATSKVYLRRFARE